MVDNNVSLQEYTQIADLGGTVEFYNSITQNKSSKVSFAFQVITANLKKQKKKKKKKNSNVLT